MADHCQILRMEVDPKTKAAQIMFRNPDPIMYGPEELDSCQYFKQQ